MGIYFVNASQEGLTKKMSTLFLPILRGVSGFLRRFFGKRFTVDVQARKPKIGAQNGTVTLIFQFDGSVFFLFSILFRPLGHVENPSAFLYESTNRYPFHPQTTK